MYGTKSLLESKTFWTQVLGLVALIAAQFQFTSLQSWAVDPNTISLVLNIGGMLSLILGMVFRKMATKQITSILPSSVPPVSPTVVKALAWVTLLSLGLGLSGCAPGGTNVIATGLTNLFADVNSIQATFQTPDGQKAIATLKATYSGTVCGLASSSGFINQIAVDAKATKVVNNTTIVIAVSKDLCTSSGGVVGQ
jgi:hypothetical protein